MSDITSAGMVSARYSKAAGGTVSELVRKLAFALKSQYMIYNTSVISYPAPSGFQNALYIILFFYFIISDFPDSALPAQAERKFRLF